MQGGDGGVHGAGELGQVNWSVCKLKSHVAEVDGVLMDTRKDSQPGSLILEIWDKGYQQVDILVFFLECLN